VKFEKGHGRLEERQIRVSSELGGYSDFPGLKQVAEIKKRVVKMKTGEVKENTEYLISSLSAEQTTPEKLLDLIRNHWGIENRLFHVKDDSFGEDRHVLYCHKGGEIMSLLRNTAINLLRGKSCFWQDTEPLTARAQCICAHPLAVLSPSS
jgi:predicted transposase YbfD/YdcC